MRWTMTKLSANGGASINFHYRPNWEKINKELITRKLPNRRMEDRIIHMTLLVTAEGLIRE